MIHESVTGSLSPTDCVEHSDDVFCNFCVLPDGAEVTLYFCGDCRGLVPANEFDLRHHMCKPHSTKYQEQLDGQ